MWWKLKEEAIGRIVWRNLWKKAMGLSHDRLQNEQTPIRFPCRRYFKTLESILLKIMALKFVRMSIMC